MGVERSFVVKFWRVRPTPTKAALAAGLLALSFLLFYLPFSGAIAGPVLQVQPTPTPPPAQTVAVSLQDPGGSGSYIFVPAHMTFKVGDTVTFVLTSEAEFHTFTVDELGIDVDVPARQTVTFTHTFTEAGTFDLVCLPHEVLDMVGTIEVVGEEEQATGDDEGVVVTLPSDETPDPDPRLADMECDSDGYCAVIRFPGRPTAMAWLSDEEFYVSTYEGSIWLINPYEDKRREVASGLVIPQGLTILDGRLYATDMNNTCDLLDSSGLGTRGADSCRGRWRDREKVLEVFPQVDARVVAYDIQEDGSLGPQQAVLGRLPTIDRDHSPNNIITDGEFLYLAIGNPQGTMGGWIYDDGGLEELEALGINTELFGAIVRFRPDGSDLRVWASGFRNPYGIAFGPDGTMYVADNGEGRESRQLEELNIVHEGGFYGFPQYGSYEASPDAGVIEPLTLISGGGSAGIVATDEGVYVGHKDGDGFVTLFEYGTWEATPVWTGRSYVTGLSQRNGVLFVLDFAGRIHAIQPDKGRLIQGRY